MILWNHRWEYDKAPEAVFRVLSDLAARGMEFAVIVAGENYQTVPDAFERGRRELGERILHFGTATEDEYPGLLAAADIVVSTARHEFFGIAVLEAVAAGALPVLPARLSYPELVPATSPFLYGDDDELVERLAWALTHPVERRLAAGQAREHARRFAWPVVAAAYDALLVDAARRRAPMA